jgi:carbamoyl-phosphate synthase small subunit
VLRDKGALNGCLLTGAALEAGGEVQASRLAKAFPGLKGMDLAKEVSVKESYDWKGGVWDLESGYKVDSDNRFKIVAYDFGVKNNILRMLVDRDCEVKVVPAQTPASEVLAMKPHGIFLSNGPGDPAALTYIHEEVKHLIGKVPVFGICLGHQILTHCFGGKTYKLKFGHRGGNHPVKDLRSGKVNITAQNHGFATDDSSLPDYIEVTHINLNDQTVEGMRSTKDPVFSVQHHPEAAPGPNDDKGFFDEFISLIESSK